MNKPRKPLYKHVWSKLLYSLNIAEIDRMGVTIQDLAEAVSFDQHKQDQLILAILMDLIRIAGKVDYKLANELKVQWSPYLQDHLPSDGGKPERPN